MYTNTDYMSLGFWAWTKEWNKGVFMCWNFYNNLWNYNAFGLSINQK